MKLFPNLAGSLRFYFGLARGLTVVFGVFWLVVLLFSPSIQKLFVDEPKLMVSIGEASLQADPGAVGLASDSAKPGSLALVTLRGGLEMDLLSKDAALVSALRWTVFPSIAVLVAYSWWLFGSLRLLCANIERKEAFSANNLRLVRNIGWILIGGSVAAFAVRLLSVFVMNGYLHHHVALSGIKSGLKFPDGLGAVSFSFSGGLLPVEGGLVMGALVLLLSEAFRQGLQLKAENDLTV